jgi:hypothetical protein
MPRNFLRLCVHAGARALQGKRGLVLLVICALPVVLSWIQTSHDPRVTMTKVLAMMLVSVFQIVLPLAGLFLGVAVLGDEIEGRTITYLFTRPQSRAVVFLARYAGVVAVSSCLLVAAAGVAVWLYEARAPVTGQQIAGTAGLAVLGFLVYAAFFAMLRLYVKRALFVGFILTFILEVAVSKLPDSGISRCTVWHHMALLESRLLGVQPRDMRHLLGGVSPDETVATSLVILGAILVVSLALGALRVRSRETRLANAST